MRRKLVYAEGSRTRPLTACVSRRPTFGLVNILCPFPWHTPREPATPHTQNVPFAVTRVLTRS